MSESLTLAQVHDPAFARTVLRRARRIRARNGVRLGRYQTLDEARTLVAAEVSRQEAIDAKILAVRTIAYALGHISIDPVRYRREYEGRQAAVALKRRRPTGVSRKVWGELVDHFQGRCFACGAVATGVGRLADDLPVPACPAHVEVSA